MYVNMAHIMINTCGCTVIRDPMTDPGQWGDFMLSADKWHSCVSQLFYIRSCHDSTWAVDEPAPTSVFRCELCVPPIPDGAKTCFATSKALESHQRAKHGVRNCIRMYIGAVSKCPACETVFGNRLSLLGHLSDKRRPKCRESVLATCPCLPNELVQKLDRLDAEQRKCAQRSGRSHSIVTRPAVNARGIQTGRVGI
jgi:hypothetical protein